ncbi:Uncharacterised protein [Serratia quinivorans]|nr:Uncharacterised protein [Serratia quinivorans]
MTQTLTTETIKLWRINAEITLGETDELDPDNNAAKAILDLTAELLRYREAAENPSCWEIAGQLFTTKEDALKPGYIGTPEPLYDGPVLTDDREAQPVGYAENGKGFIYHPEHRDRIKNPVAVFTAPPAPVENSESTGATAVPDFKALAENLVENLVDCGGADEEAVEQYLAFAEKTCRAAMLDQPVSQRYKLADSSGGWIEHDGDSIPKSLDRNALVYLKTRGKELKFPYPAGIVRWGHFNNDFDIVAYKMAAAPEGGN